MKLVSNEEHGGGSGPTTTEIDLRKAMGNISSPTTIEIGGFRITLTPVPDACHGNCTHSSKSAESGSETSPAESGADDSGSAEESGPVEEDPLLRVWEEMDFDPEITEVFDFQPSTQWGTPLINPIDPEKIEDDSPSRKEWLRLKKENHERNEYLDQIMSFVGHEEVKAHFLHVKSRFEVAKKWGEDLSKLRFDLVLQGNHGTGM